MNAQAILESIQKGEGNPNHDRQGLFASNPSGVPASRIKGFSGESKAILKGLGDARLGEAGKTLKGITLMPGPIFGAAKAFGTYSDLSHKVELTTAGFKPELLKSSFAPGQWQVAYTAKNQTEFLSRVLLHELGHHLGNRADVRKQIERAFAGGAKPITKYAAVSAREYFAETHAAYVYHPDTLKQYDPVGFKLVEDLRSHLGLSHG